MPTHLLDWSNNVLAALYFAVRDPYDPTDAAVYMLDAYEFQPHPKIGRGIATSRRPAFKDAVDVISRWNDKVTSASFPDAIFPVRPDKFDVRMSLQRAGFTFHVPKQQELTSAVNQTLTIVVIDGKSKSDLKNELAALGLDDFGVFGDLDSLARQLKGAYGIQ